MMRILSDGGSGFLGRRLAERWLAAGESITVLSRDPVRAASKVDPRATVRSWAPPLVDEHLLEAVGQADAIVNLAGAPIGGRPWTPRHKHAISASRLDATRAIVEAIERTPPGQRPKTLVNASGIDVYGDRPTGVMTEDSAPGDSFLARVVVAWEHAARTAAASGVRVVHARTALIVAREALAWRLILLPFRAFLGGRLGSGRQRFTWIHVADAVGLYDLALRDEAIDGPLNMVAPVVPTQTELARAIAKAMHRPAVFPVPATLLRIVLWGQADIVLHGRNARPARAEAAGYAFVYPTLESALDDVLGPST
jgi:uncharacterized protein (TIGR01777 family)